MIPKNYFSAICLLLSSTICCSGNIDLSIEINPSSISILSAGDIGEFSITITNHGPDDAGLNSPVSYPISLDSEIIYLEDNGGFVDFISNPDIVQECLFFPTILDPVPGNLVGVIYSFFMPVIPAGDSITCSGLYYVNFDNGIKTLEWSPFSVTDNDTDPSNDIALMTFRGFVAPVPSLNMCGLFLLILMFLAMGFRFSIKPK